MARNLIQDIKRKPTVKKEINFRNLDLGPKKENDFPVEIKVHKKSKNRLWFIALISIVFLFFALSFFFAKATVTISPKKQDLNLKQDFSANKDNSSGLSFDLVVISGEESKAVKSTSTKNVETKAIGQVIIYNNFSTGPQTLVKNTTLEGSNGKNYKTNSKVVVPGMTKDGKVGKIEVSVTATLSGEEYNSTPLDFKLPIFKGTAKYTKFYARSKGDISGGLSGKYYQISDADKLATVAILKGNLTNKLSQKIINQTPAGFILFKDAVFLNTNEDSINTSSPSLTEDGMVNVTLKGTLYGFLFNEKKLTKKIAENAITKYDGSDVHIPNIKDLVFTLVDKNISFADVKKIDFNLSGISKIVWNVDSANIIASLLGKSTKEFRTIMAEYENLDSANLKMSPPWKMSIPDKSKNIIIVINKDN